MNTEHYTSRNGVLFTVKKYCTERLPKFLSAAYPLHACRLFRLLSVCVISFCGSLCPKILNWFLVQILPRTRQLGLMNTEHYTSRNGALFTVKKYCPRRPPEFLSGAYPLHACRLFRLLSVCVRIFNHSNFIEAAGWFGTFAWAESIPHGSIMSTTTGRPR